MLYRLILFIHIFSATVSIGPFFTLLPIIKRIKNSQGEALNAYLDVVKVSIRIIKHAGHVLVISGLVLLYMGSWSWKTSWILLTMVLMISSLIFLAQAFRPTLAKFNDDNFNQVELGKQLKTSIWIYIILLGTMLFFMVVKPRFW